MTENLPRIRTPKSTYTFDYPVALEAARLQRSIFWTPEEIKVEKDIQDLRANMSPAEYHGVVTVLKLFVLYELEVGSSYWQDKVQAAFPRPEIQQAACAFNFMELNVHAPFYNKINEAMMLADDAFFESYKEDETLAARMQFVEDAAEDDDLLFAIAVFSMLEGAVLYSSFAFLKHFQAEGKNLLNTVNTGISFSVRDEALHHETGAWLFRTLRDEENAHDRLPELKKRIDTAADQILEHETRIIDMIFEHGEIEGITKDELVAFVKSRLNLCYSKLDFDDRYEVGDNPVAGWFYKGINAVQFGDFFNGVQNEYNRNTGFEDVQF